MKKFLVLSAKAFLFFVGWALCSALIPIPNPSSAVIWRLWAEAIPLISIIVFTVLFWLLDRKKANLHLIDEPVKNMFLGSVTGIAWLGTAVILLLLTGVMQIESVNRIPMLGIWIFALFLNTITQEMLIRGYLYRMIQASYNTAAAGTATTILFTVLHGGAFEAGFIPVLNVLTTSIFITIVLEYTGSLIAPVMIHFLWNMIGAVFLGGVSLPDDYPHIFNTVFIGNPLLSGGLYKIEGSIIVFFLNLCLIGYFGFAVKKRRRS